MNRTALGDLLWALGFLSTLVLLSIFLWRGYFRRFPVFTSWIAFVSAKDIFLFIVFRTRSLGHLYAELYWGDLWPEFAIELGVALEVARAALRRNTLWIGDAKRLFLFGAACGIVISALLCVWIVPPPGAYKVWELRADLFASLVLCELLVSVTVIANLHRLAWDRHVLAIAEGLTVWGAVSLVVNALETYLGSQYFNEIDHFQSYAWIGAMMWIAMEFGLPNATTESPAGQPTEDSARTPDKSPPGMLRPIPGIVTAFRKLCPPAATSSHGISPSLPAGHSLNGSQS
jgi:hypothetical protein